MASYSPYSKTKITTEGTLGILAIRPVPAYSEDPLYTVEPQYTHRPDLLAYDLKCEALLFFVFLSKPL